MPDCLKAGIPALPGAKTLSRKRFFSRKSVPQCYHKRATMAQEFHARVVLAGTNPSCQMFLPQRPAFRPCLGQKHLGARRFVSHSKGHTVFYGKMEAVKICEASPHIT